MYTLVWTFEHANISAARDFYKPSAILQLIMHLFYCLCGEYMCECVRVPLACFRQMLCAFNLSKFKKYLLTYLAYNPCQAVYEAGADVSQFGLICIPLFIRMNVIIKVT